MEALANQHSYWCPQALGPNPWLQLSPFPAFQIGTESLPSALIPVEMQHWLFDS